MSTSDNTNDMAATSASTTRYGRCEEVAAALVRRRTNRISHAVPMIKAGHTR